MSEFYYPATLTSNGELQTVTAFNAESDNPVYQADSNHPNWEAILTGLRTGDSAVWDLFDIAGTATRAFRQITDRVSFNGADILWDGDPVHSALSDHLLRVIQSGNVENYTAVAKFWEKLESNPSEHSRQQTYNFLANHKFQITSDGDVVAYKSMAPQADGSFVSGRASDVPDLPSGYVNGQAVPPRSRIPQKTGDVVTMPRSEVVHDPNESCARGLHVGTVNYFGGWGAHTVEVYVNPRDFVSVPNGEDAKARVCRYVVGPVVREEGPNTNAPVSSTASAWVGDVGTRV